MKISVAGQWIVAVTALLMGLYAYLVAYGFLQGTPEDTERALFHNAMLVIGFLGVQTLFSALKKGAGPFAVIGDWLASMSGFTVSAYALFQEFTQNAEALTTYQERVLFVILGATLIDVLANTANDLIRLFLTDEMKMIQG